MAPAPEKEVVQLDLFADLRLPEALPWSTGDKVRGSTQTGGDGTVRKIFELDGKLRAEVLWPRGRVGEYEYSTPVAQNLPLSALRRLKA